MSMKIENAIMSYDGKKKVLNNLDVKFADTGMYGIVGRSGSGKSTLINIVSGQDSFTSGKLLLDDEDVTNNSAKLRDSVSVVYQEYHLLPELNVYDNIEIAIRLSGGHNTKEDIILLMDRLGIKDLSSRTVKALSGGEKQRVAIARAYLSGRNIIIADEPTGNLDYENAKFVFNMLREISKEKLVIVVSHDMELVKEYISILYVLRDGRLHKIYNEIDIKAQENTVVVQEHVIKGSRVSQRMKFRNYLELSWGFLVKKKIALICMILISSIALSLFAISFSVVRFDPVDQIMGNYDSIELKTAEANFSADKMDKSIMSKYDDLLAKGNSFDDIYELPDGDIGLDLIAGTMPKNYTEYIISSGVVDDILETGQMVDGVASYEQGETVMKSLSSSADIYDIIGQESYYINQKVKIVGVYDLHDSEHMKDYTFYGKGLLDYKMDNSDGYEMVGKVGLQDNSFTLQFGGDEDNLGYMLGLVGGGTNTYAEDVKSRLINIDGMEASRMPVGSKEIILQCPELVDGRKIYTYKIGDEIKVKEDVNGELTMTVVGYYSPERGGEGANYGSNDYNNVYYNGFGKEPEGLGWFDSAWLELDAYMDPAGLSEYLKLKGKTYNTILFDSTLRKEMYSDLYNAGINMLIDSGSDNLDERDIVYINLPAKIILGVAIALILLVCTVCSIVLLKGNFKSMAILSGLGARSSDIVIITCIMAAILSLFTLAIGLPLAVILNVLMMLGVSLGMMIGAVEIFTSIGILLGIYLISIGVSAVILRRTKIVNSLRVE